MTKAELARELGVSRSYITMIEQGRQSQSQNKLAKELGISKSYLSMILNGQRKLTPELEGKLSSVFTDRSLIRSNICGSGSALAKEVESLPLKEYIHCRGFKPSPWLRSSISG